MDESEINALVQSLTGQIARLSLELAQRDARIATLEAEAGKAAPANG